MPVAVADDHVACLTARDALGDRREHVGERARAREVDAWSAAGVVQVIVGQSGNDGLTLEIDDRRVRSGQPADAIGLADGGETPVRDRDRLCNREAPVDGHDMAVHEDRVRRRRRGSGLAERR